MEFAGGVGVANRAVADVGQDPECELVAGGVEGVHHRPRLRGAQRAGRHRSQMGVDGAWISYELSPLSTRVRRRSNPAKPTAIPASENGSGTGE